MVKSISEKKAMVLEKLAALQKEEDIDAILMLLEKLNIKTGNNGSAINHAFSIIKERSSVLERLAN